MKKKIILELKNDVQTTSGKHFDGMSDQIPV